MKTLNLKWRRLAAPAVLLAVLLAGAQTGPVHADKHASVTSFPGFSPTLLANLGGEVGLQNIVDQFYEIASGDNRINAVLFDRTSHAMRDAQKKALIETLMGKPTVVAGTSRAGVIELTATQYGALIEDLYDALDRARVSYHTSNRALTKLAPYKASLVSAYLNARPSIEGSGEVHVGPVEQLPSE